MAPPSIEYPLFIARDHDGYLWFGDNGSSSLGRVSPTGQILEVDISGQRYSRGIAFGPDNSLWIAKHDRIAHVVCPPDVGVVDGGR